MSTRTCQHGRDGGRRSGLTLIEMIVSMATMTLLFAAIGSAIIVAAGAVPDRGGAAGAMIDGAEALEELSAELPLALGFTERTAAAVTFTVADRDGDAQPETIRYAWSGTAGDPLTREYNAKAPAIVAVDVREFQLAYDRITVTEQVPTRTGSGEVSLAGYPETLAVNDFRVRQTEWIGQYFEPSLPADAIEWAVTRVLVVAVKDGPPNGTTLIQLRPPDSSLLPTAAVVDQQAIDEALLGSYTWHEFSFPGATGLDPDDAMCIVLEWVSDTTSAKVAYESGGTGRLETLDGGLSWSHDPTESMRYQVYGTYVRPGADRPVDRVHLTGVTVALRTGGDATAALQTSIPLLDVREVAP